MPPVVVAAGIGAAAGIGGAALSASAQKKAAKSASNSAASTAAANNALARENREFSAARLDPYAHRGNEAGNAINALLGISGTLPAANPTGGMANGGTNPNLNTWAQGAINAMMPRITRSNVRQQLGSMSDNPVQALDYLMQLSPPSSDQYPLYQQYLASNPRPQATAAPAATQPAVTNPQGAYNNAFQNYLNSTGYQFQLGEGNKAINQGYAARGSLQSGAALKALQTYGQNTATGFFKDYLGLLANQQGVGLSGASAVAGVGQNYVNNVSANNNAAGSAAANAALMAGNANANLYGNIAGGIAGVANAFGSSYRRT